jgi:hypothetical protein
VLQLLLGLVGLSLVLSPRSLLPWSGRQDSDMTLFQALCPIPLYVHTWCIALLLIM